MNMKITLVLENLRSCHNVGSILRSADGFGVDSVVFVGTTPYPQLLNDSRLPHIRRKQTAAIAKTALGAETHSHKYTYIQDIDHLLKQLTNTPLYALEQSATSTSLREFLVDATHITLVVGNEVDGVSDEVLRCSEHLEIPMHGKKESFNVAVATAIALYQIRQ